MSFSWENITTALDIYALFTFLFYFSIGTITCFVFLRFFFKKEIRMFRNLKRKVYLLKTNQDALETEMEMLNKNGLFSKVERVYDISAGLDQLQTFEDFAIYVAEYSGSYEFYPDLVATAKVKKIPLIILAKPENRISSEHMSKFQQHIYFEMCNSSARLLTLLLNLALVSPYDKR